MRRPLSDHERHDWRVHAIARDCELLDVWRFPIRVEPERSFAEVTHFIADTLARTMRGSGPAALLFRLRGLLGRIFGWDDELRREEVAPSAAGAAGAKPAAPSITGFEPVYLDERETLLEIENATVHAFMHLGRVALDESDPDGAWAPQMAVYARPKGAFGRAYMAAISPFRHWIVYPALMRAVARAWPGHAGRTGSVRSSDGPTPPSLVP